MHFSLYAQPEQEAAEYFFTLHSDQEVIYSPFFSDRQAALKAMEKLVLDLRAALNSRKLRPQKHHDSYRIPLFGKSKSAYGTTLTFNDQEAAQQSLENWQAAALATTFRVIHFEVDLTNKDKNQESTDSEKAAERWQEKGSSLLHIAHKKRKLDIPAMGINLAPTDGPCEPIFNALQPFASAGFPLFHGRKKETEEIFALLKQRNLLLVYGAAKVGKTSLLQAGIGKNCKDAKEQFLIIHKKRNQDILEAFIAQLQQELRSTPNGPTAQTNDPIQLAQLFNEQAPNRNFIVFDHIDHLFKPDVFDAERNSFFRLIRELIKGDDNPFRIILSVREEFLAHLADYETELPDLLTNRFRLLPLAQGASVNVTANLLDILKIGGKIGVDDPREVSQAVINQLVNDKGEVPMHCIQVYLHQMHQQSCSETTEGPVPMTPELVEKLGPAPMVINSFYHDQLNHLRNQLPKEGAPRNYALEEQIAELEQSRLNCGCDDKNAKNIATAAVAPANTNWLAAAALALIPLGVFFLSWWINPQENNLSICETARAEDDCAAYINYLCQEDRDDECTQEFHQILQEKDCPIYQDYLKISQDLTCESYQNFFDKYNKRGVCMDLVQSRLLGWACPIVRDTVQLTVRDTVIRNISTATPSTYGPNVSALPRGQNPPCKQIAGINFKSIGPLWIMTESLSGGPYSWEDALDACSDRGFRLPCIGEIDFLIEKIYRDDPKRAYEMLSGGDACVLANPNTAPNSRIEFWTATEANDATAWSYYFDFPSETIGRQAGTPKSARLPCLCVQKDQTQNSGIPACYGKKVDRVPGL